MKKALIAAALTAGTLAVTAAPSSATPPNEQACLGEFFSASAQAGPLFAEQIVVFAQNSPQITGHPNLGQGLQQLLAGDAPLFPDVCN